MREWKYSEWRRAMWQRDWTSKLVEKALALPRRVQAPLTALRSTLPTLRGWAAYRCELLAACLYRVDPVAAWTDGTCSVFRLLRPNDSRHFLYRYAGVAEALVDFDARRIDLWPLSSDCTEATLDHFLVDVLLPGILDHEGDLVLHAGAVVIDGAAAVLVGESGRGKSTLTASFFAEGHTVLSDDGIIVTDTGNGTSVEAVYPGIRLLPGTLSDLFASPVPTTDVAHYATKRRIVPDARMSSAGFPVAAMFFLSEPSGAGWVSVAPMSRAEACMGLVSKSFALDPSDKDRARGRIEQASRVANTLPAYALSYPRKISSLPKVRDAIIGALAVGGPRDRPFSVR